MRYRKIPITVQMNRQTIERIDQISNGMRISRGELIRQFIMECMEEAEILKEMDVLLVRRTFGRLREQYKKEITERMESD